MDRIAAGEKLYAGKVLEGEMTTSALLGRFREMQAFRESRRAAVGRCLKQFFAALIGGIVCLFLLQKVPPFHLVVAGGCAVWGVYALRAWNKTRQPLDTRAEKFLTSFCTPLADDLLGDRLTVFASLLPVSSTEILVSTSPKYQKGSYNNCIDRTFTRLLLRAAGRLRDGSRVAVTVREKVIVKTLKRWKKNRRNKYKSKVKVQQRCTASVKLAVAVPPEWQIANIRPLLPPDCRARALNRKGRPTLLVSFKEKNRDPGGIDAGRTLELLQIIHRAFMAARAAGKGVSS